MACGAGTMSECFNEIKPKCDIFRFWCSCIEDKSSIWPQPDSGAPDRVISPPVKQRMKKIYIPSDTVFADLLAACIPASRYPEPECVTLVLPAFFCDKEQPLCIGSAQLERAPRGCVSESPEHYEVALEPPNQELPA